jgi:hypothetical protein
MKYGYLAGPFARGKPPRRAGNAFSVERGAKIHMEKREAKCIFFSFLFDLGLNEPFLPYLARAFLNQEDIGAVFTKNHPKITCQSFLLFCTISIRRPVFFRAQNRITCFKEGMT